MFTYFNDNNDDSEVGSHLNNSITVQISRRIIRTTQRYTTFINVRAAIYI